MAAFLPLGEQTLVAQAAAEPVPETVAEMLARMRTAGPTSAPEGPRSSGDIARVLLRLREELQSLTLVQNGLAIPEDEECRLACNRTEHQLAAARMAMTKLLSGKSISDDSEDSEE